MRYAIKCWVDEQATQKALVGDPKPKARKTTSASSSTTSCSQSATKREIQIQAKLDQLLERIELQDKNYQKTRDVKWLVLASLGDVWLCLHFLYYEY
uniref:Uncharacterized protein n=1 Tax=Cucumis melo TaxID=3656 RepID=A0A9I9E534_CUCME